MSAHICPYCGSTNIQFGLTSLQHTLRFLTNSPKRYCLDCDKKWMLKSKGSQISLPLLFGLFSAAVLGVLIIDKMGVLSVHSEKQQSDTTSLNPQLIEKARQKMEADPDALTKLSPQNKKKAEAAIKKYGISVP